MSKRKAITIHGNLRLTPKLVNVLATIAEEFHKPEIRYTQEGMVIYVDTWDGLTNG